MSIVAKESDSIVRQRGTEDEGMVWEKTEWHVYRHVKYQVVLSCERTFKPGCVAIFI